MKNNVETTVIGSYPVDIDSLDLMKSFYNKKYPSWNKYIKSAVDDMIKAGINIVSDGQTRDPFVNIYFRKIKGCRIRDRPEVIDKIEFVEPITVEDQKFVKKIIPKKTKTIGLLTGPYTLAKSCVNMHYKSEEDLSFDLAHVLQKEAEILEKHVDLISIDEPFFSVSFPEYAKDLIEIITKKISCKKRLHVCGDVSNIIPSLLDMPIDILSHEFKAQPGLIDSFKNYSVSKDICLGSVRSDKKIVEDVSEIKKHISNSIDVFDDKISQIAPDCGLRQVPRENAFRKLKNLVKACEDVYGKECSSN